MSTAITLVIEVIEVILITLVIEVIEVILITLVIEVIEVILITLVIEVIEVILITLVIEVIEVILITLITFPGLTAARRRRITRVMPKPSTPVKTPPLVLAVISQKGGTGKTTLSCGLAAVADAAGIATVILDTDPQGSAAQWSTLRQATIGPTATPCVMTCDAAEIAGLIPKLADAEAGLIVIDSAPASNSAARRVAALAHTIVVPAAPRPRTWPPSPTPCRSRGTAVPPPTSFSNQAIPRHPQIPAAQQILAEYGKLAPIVIHQRVRHSTAFGTGQTAPETGRTSKAARELQALYAWLATQNAVPAIPASAATGAAAAAA